MDIKEIKQIVEMMKRSDLTEFEIEEEGLKLRIKRDADNPPANPQVVHSITPAPVSPVPVAGTQAAPQESAATPADDNSKIIKSPMVGTFYRSPGPDNPPFTEVGAKIAPDSVVCIIEAMKVMNEIQAEFSGTIKEILVENEASVEYGQPLFKVEPS